MEAAAEAKAVQTVHTPRPLPVQDVTDTAIILATSVSPRRPVGQTSPMPSCAKSTAVVTPQTHPPVTVQRVTPQLRALEIPVQAVTPHSQEQSSQQPLPSTSHVSSLTPSHQHHEAASTSRVDDASIPSTSGGTSGEETPAVRREHSCGVKFSKNGRKAVQSRSASLFAEA